jgi:hypothetical protein
MVWLLFYVVCFAVLSVAKSIALNGMMHDELKKSLRE